jgi:hypothetical protein
MAKIVIVIEDVPGPDLIDVKVDPPGLMTPSSGDTPAVRAGQVIAGLGVGAKLLLATGVNVGLDVAAVARPKLGAN